MKWCWNGDRGWCAFEGRFALIDGCRWVAYDRFGGEMIDQGVEETKDDTAKRAEQALIWWERASDGIRARFGERAVTVQSMRGDGYLWRLVGTDVWGMTETEAEAKKQALDALMRGR